ncbi:MAG: hypothetical protein AB7U30_06410 [Sulfuricellaceae bacterium]|jgi:hypothetical protein
MSRSYRRTPILPVTNGRSEKFDKKQWHRRWRLHERIRLTARLRGGDEVALEGYLPVAVREVSNLWGMDKDGKSYWSASRRLKFAELLVKYKPAPDHERGKLVKRHLRRFMAK